MGNDKQGTDNARSERLDSSRDRDDGARSVTDLIDIIERTAFERYLSDRKTRAQLRWSEASPSRAEI
ncbi:MAG TPA: hypothetical protein VGC50_01340 [Gammaproteobacteria bacterium]|jgi:hypothetical protein